MVKYACRINLRSFKPMWTVFQQILILLLFVATGYVLGKTKIIKSEHSGVLSKLLVYVFLPCNVLKTFSSRFNISYITSNWSIILLSTVIVLVTALVAFFASKLFSKDAYERRVFEYSTVIPNSGYMGIPLAESIFGQTGTMGIMTMALPLQIYIYTYGYAILTKQGLKIKKLANPVMIATAVGMLLGLCEFPMPTFVSSVLDGASACMAPISMMLTGLVISEFKLSKIVLNPKIYPVIALRLVAIPLVVGAVLKLCGTDPHITAIAILLFSLPCGMNSVVFPKLVGEDCRAGAGISLVSTLASAITVPIMFLIFGIQL